MDICSSGLGPEYITPERTGFLNWPDIQKLCYEKDPYATFVIYHFDKIGKDFPELFTTVKGRAAQNYAPAQTNLGWMYKEGHGVGGKSLTTGGVKPEHILEALHWTLKGKQQEAKVFIRSCLLTNVNVSVSTEDGSFKTKIAALKHESQTHVINSIDLLPEIQYLYKLVIEAKQQLLSTIESLETVSGGFMVTAVSLCNDLVKDGGLNNQITPFFSVDELDGISYLTMGERNVVIAKSLKTCFGTLTELGIQLAKIRGFKSGVAFAQDRQHSAPDAPIDPVVRSFTRIIEEGEQPMAIEPRIKSLIRSAGSRNHDVFEENPLLEN